MVFEHIWRNPDEAINYGHQWNPFSDNLRVTDMNYIVSNLNFVADNINLFTENAAEALRIANQANELAIQTAEDIQVAVNASTEAIKKAAKAETDSSDALTKATNAETTANGIDNKASSALEKATNAETTANNTAEELAKLDLTSYLKKTDPHLKSATVANNTLTLTKEDDTTVEFKGGTDVDSALSETSENPVQNKVINEALKGKLNTSGGTLTGNLTGQWISGTWLRTTAGIHTSNDSYDVPVLQSGGWFYSRTKTEFKNDLGVPTEYVKDATKSTDGKTLTLTKQDGSTVDFMGGTDIDDTLSNTSTNPVQNKVINEALKDKASLSTDNTFAGANQIFTGFLSIRGTAADGHLKTRGISGSTTGGEQVEDLYLQYANGYKTHFGTNGQSTLNADGTVSIKGVKAATVNDIPTEYVKDAKVNNLQTKLTLTKQDGSYINFYGGETAQITQGVNSKADNYVDFSKVYFSSIWGGPDSNQADLLNGIEYPNNQIALIFYGKSGYGNKTVICIGSERHENFPNNNSRNDLAYWKFETFKMEDTHSYITKRGVSNNKTHTLVYNHRHDTLYFTNGGNYVGIFSNKTEGIQPDGGGTSSPATYENIATDDEDNLYFYNSNNKKLWNYNIETKESKFYQLPSSVVVKRVLYGNSEIVVQTNFGVYRGKTIENMVLINNGVGGAIANSNDLIYCNHCYCFANNGTIYYTQLFEGYETIQPFYSGIDRIYKISNNELIGITTNSIVFGTPPYNFASINDTQSDKIWAFVNSKGAVSKSDGQAIVFQESLQMPIICSIKQQLTTSLAKKVDTLNNQLILGEKTFYDKTQINKLNVDTLTIKNKSVGEVVAPYVYPIGSIYIQETSGTSNVGKTPMMLFPGTNWTNIENGRFLRVTTGASGGKGGSNTHTHQYGYQDNQYYRMPGFESNSRAGVLNYNSSNGITGAGGHSIHGQQSTAINHAAYTRTDNRGANLERSTANTSYSNNIPAYINVIVWKRIG